MRTKIRNSSISAILVLVTVLAVSVVSRAQTTRQPTTAGGAKNATSSVPDLSGVWSTVPRATPLENTDLHGSKQTIAPEVDHADLFTFRHSAYPLQPWAKEKFDYNKDPENPYYAGRAALNPYLQCLPEGPTIPWLGKHPFEVVQSQKRILFVFESNHEIRQVWMDGREHPKDFGHTWMGHSVGHWEGNTLVVDTVGLNDLTWLDYAGHVHSEDLHLIEKFTRDGDKMTLDITFDDPKAFTQVWSARVFYQFRPNWELDEQINCEDHFLGKTVPLR